MIFNDSIESVKYTYNPDGSSYHNFIVNGQRFRLYHDKWNSEYSIKIPSKRNHNNYIIATSNNGRVWDILINHNENSYGQFYRRNIIGDHIKIASMMLNAINENIQSNHKYFKTNNKNQIRRKL